MRYFYIICISVFGIMAILLGDRVIEKTEQLKINIKYKSKIANSLGYLLFAGYAFYMQYTVFFISMYILLYLLLYYINLIDRQYQIIPDKYPLIIFILGIINNFMRITAWRSSLKAFCLVLLFFIFIVSYEYFTKTDDILGGGDIKLFFALSIFLGFNYTYAILFLSHLLRILRVYLNVQSKTRDSIHPFAPYIYISFALLPVFERLYTFLLKALLPY